MVEIRNNNFQQTVYGGGLVSYEWDNPEDMLIVREFVNADHDILPPIAKNIEEAKASSEVHSFDMSGLDDRPTEGLLHVIAAVALHIRGRDFDRVNLVAPFVPSVSKEATDAFLRDLVSLDRPDIKQLTIYCTDPSGDIDPVQRKRLISIGNKIVLMAGEKHTVTYIEGWTPDAEHTQVVSPPTATAA